MTRPNRPELRVSSDPLETLMAPFAEADFETCASCPWCQSTRAEPWGRALRGFASRRCCACDVIYVQRRLTREAQERFYAGYLSRSHEADAALLAARQRMYEVEYQLIAPHVPPGRVLDVGCSRGGFLDVFAANGFEGYGVELGSEAAQAARERFQVWQGELPALELPGNFDLVVFRGVIEHCLDPKAYLRKAWEQLRVGGVLYLTSTPNRDALCCDLFQELWNQHEPEGHLLHLAVRHLDAFLTELGSDKLFERYLYLETPYADPARDAARVAEAQERRARGEPLVDTSPAFEGNMLSVAYRKR